MLNCIVRLIRKFLPDRYDTIIRFIACSTIIFVAVSAHDISNGGTDQIDSANIPKETPWSDPVVILTFGIVFFNGILCLITYFLFDSTNRLWRVSERALVDLEAPFISIKILETGLPVKQGEVGHNFEQLFFSIVNLGRTPATLVELVDKTKMIPENDGYPPPIDLDFRSREEMPRGVISPPNGESQPFYQNLFANHLNELAADPLPLRKNAIFFYGFVRYETIFSHVFRLGFCFIFDRFTSCWHLSGGSKYNYLERER
jgi:hypothetical protein